MYKLILSLVLIVSSLGYSAQLTPIKKLSDAGLEKLTAAYGKLKSDFPIFEDQSSGDVYRVEVGEKSKDESWINTNKQLVHKSNAAAKRAKIEEGSLKLTSSTATQKSLTQAFKTFTGRIQDAATEKHLKELLEDAELNKEKGRFKLYYGDYSTSNNSCEVAVFQDTKELQAAVLTTCYNE